MVAQAVQSFIQQAIVTTAVQDELHAFADHKRRLQTLMERDRVSAIRSSVMRDCVSGALSAAVQSVTNRAVEARLREMLPQALAQALTPHPPATPPSASRMNYVHEISDVGRPVPRPSRKLSASSPQASGPSSPSLKSPPPTPLVQSKSKEQLPGTDGTEVSPAAPPDSPARMERLEEAREDDSVRPEQTIPEPVPATSAPLAPSPPRGRPTPQEQEAKAVGVLKALRTGQVDRDKVASALKRYRASRTGNRPLGY